MQIANRATGSEPELEMNKEIQLTFSDGYTTKVQLTHLLPSYTNVDTSSIWVSLVIKIYFLI